MGQAWKQEAGSARFDITRKQYITKVVDENCELISISCNLVQDVLAQSWHNNEPTLRPSSPCYHRRTGHLRVMLGFSEG